MAWTQYTYSVQNDFPNQAVSVGSLDSEIRRDPSISVQLMGVNHRPGNDVVRTVFADALPRPQKTSLDNVVASHQGTELVDSEQGVLRRQESTSSDTTWGSGLRLQPGAIKAGLWQCNWHCEFDLEASVYVPAQGYISVAQVRLVLNGDQWSLDSWPFNRPHVFSGSKQIRYQDGDTPNIALQLRVQGAAAVVRARNCQITLSPPVDI